MEKLDSRKETLLKLTVRSYVKSAEPVGSAWLSEHSGLDVSSATIRNELAALEEAGYLVQPHTSAGRIPTELGYRYYISRFLEKKPAGKELDAVKTAVAEAEEEAERFRNAAKALADLARGAVLVGFGPRNVYYTGLSNLFGQPEFREIARVASMSKVLDHLDEAMERVFPTATDEAAVAIGSDNPFGAECGALIIRAPFGGTAGIMAILGPMRMDYDADWSLLSGTVKILKMTS